MTIFARGTHVARCPPAVRAGLLVLGSLGSCVLACNDSPPAARFVPGSGSGAACQGASATSFDQLWPSYFAPTAPTGCATASCHGAGAGSYAFSTAPEMWAASVGQLSVLDPGMKRVAPGDPLHSYLYLKLLPTADGRMPLGGPYLDDTGLAAVLGWICAGAPSPTNPLPVLSSISPTTVSAGTGAFSLTVDGSDFVPGSVVEVDGASRTTHYVSTVQLTADILASDDASAGTPTITVVSPTPGGGTSAGATMTISNQPNPLPSLSSIVPNVVAIGSSAISLTVYGSGFVVNSSVLVNGSARTTHYVSGRQLTADLPSSDFAAAGSLTITVFNPAPGGGTSGRLALVVKALPAISFLQPCGLVAGAGAFTLTINGANFASGVTASFGGTSVAVTFVSSTQLTAAIPSALVATAPADDAVPVVVTNPGPDASNVAYFGVATKASTLSANVQPIFTASCATASCHVTGGTTPMSLEAGKSLAALVGVVSTSCAPTLRVLACGPLRSQSVLVDKILATASSPPCSGSPMPRGAPLTAAQKQAIVDWVAQGAAP
jgi:IPT/TIG domain-containing protein